MSEFRLKMAFGLLVCLVLGWGQPGQSAEKEREKASVAPIAVKDLPTSIGPAWKDRRPIGQYYLSQEQYVTPNNPGGYLNREVDVSTEAGRVAFHTLLQESADRWIAILKENNAQGMIVWDLEGYSQAGMVYVGDSRVLPQYAPQMDVEADAFFKKFRTAGLRTGVCIRPNRVRLNSPKDVAVWGKWGYDLYDSRTDDVVKELSERIAYAQKRWGCTLFYMDSNFYGKWEGETKKDVVVDAEMLRQLRVLHPDVLIIPEHPTSGGREWTAQYQEVRGGWRGTPAEERAQFPGAFSVISVGGGHLGLAEMNWEALVASIGQGDSTFMDGWYPSDINKVVQHLYQQAEYQKSKLPAGTDLKSVSDLLRLVDSRNQAQRFLAVRALGNLPLTTQGERLLTLAKGDSNWLVQKEAIVALGKLEYAPALPTLYALADSETPGLNYFAQMTYVSGDAIPAPAPGEKNWALAGNGATATASSQTNDKDGNFPAQGVIDGVRDDTGWAKGHGWVSAAGTKLPQWLEIQLASEATINRFVVINYHSAGSPTFAAKWGVSGYEIQAWNAAANKWKTVVTQAAGRAVNTRVHNLASPVKTSKFRVLVNDVVPADGRARLLQVEAWGRG